MKQQIKIDIVNRDRVNAELVEANGRAIVTYHPSLLALGYLPQSEFARVALAYGAWLRSIGSVEGQLSDRTYRGV